MYADGRELLVFRTFLQSVRLSKKSETVKISFLRAKRGMGGGSGCKQ